MFIQADTANDYLMCSDRPQCMLKPFFYKLLTGISISFTIIAKNNNNKSQTAIIPCFF